MSWDVENTDEFGDWFVELDEADQAAIAVTVDRLEGQGPNLRFPFSSGINNCRHSHMRELRIQGGRQAVTDLLRIRSASVGNIVDWRRQDWGWALLRTDDPARK